jgi:hypothetical protein
LVVVVVVVHCIIWSGWHGTSGVIYVMTFFFTSSRTSVMGGRAHSSIILYGRLVGWSVAYIHCRLHLQAGLGAFAAAFIISVQHTQHVWLPIVLSLVLSCAGSGILVVVVFLELT